MNLSPNFIFLTEINPQLLRLATLAERYLTEDPVTCLMKLRQFAELLAQLVAAKVGLYQDSEENQLKLLNRLGVNNLIPGEIGSLFHELRRAGNEATHQNLGSYGTALHCLKYTRQLALWYVRTFENVVNLQTGSFIPPTAPPDETAQLKAELAELRKLAQQTCTQKELAEAKALEEAELREIAEELLTEIEQEKELFKQQLVQLQAQSLVNTNQLITQKAQKAQIYLEQIDLDEGDTRRLIDAQLRQAGWEADSEILLYAQGIRPEKGKNRAIAEYPVKNGKADYVLFIGLEAVGIIEAKRQSQDVYSDIDQAKRYSKSFLVKDEVKLCEGSKWGDYAIPFVFATNGREFLRQLATKTGIWFCDLRNPQNLRRSLQSWYSPEGLQKLLTQNISKSHQELTEEGFNYNLELRDYQIKAIQAVEANLSQQKRELLLAMATGTGKTKTAIALIYRLLKTKRFRRVLFLVDRTALGEQAGDVFQETRIENLQTFANIFEVKDLSSNNNSNFDYDVKVHIATVQSFVSKLFYNNNEDEILTVDEYDCIFVDECHRGYLLDQELSETELVYRDFKDYISKYRRVLDYFDAVKIGLTATPALHTTEIFGEPVFIYSYREAVIDGWLIDHEPPIRLVTKLAEEGIKWDQGELMEYFDPLTGKIDLIHAPDEVKIEVNQFNRQVITESFNQVICDELVNYLDPFSDEKTLIFCVKDDHADLVVKLLKDSLVKKYGNIDDDLVKKITGKVDKPLEAIRRFKNEVNPKIAVTVDLLTTGIDVPAISNLVFLRRVNSRILYEQMLGRATRRCDEIGKEIFRIFDAVSLYEGLSPVSSMKPVVNQPNLSFNQLINELEAFTPNLQGEEDNKKEEILIDIVEQILAKLQRKKRNLSENSRQQIERIAGINYDDVINFCKHNDPQDVAQWWQEKREIAQFLDLKDGGRKPILISHHPDELIRVETGYGEGTKPQDYLQSFNQFLQENLNQIPALLIVTQRPKELTRKQLKELLLILDQAGFTEKNLQVAWREMTNEDITANIIGFIRQSALGNALIPYSQRVERAINKVLMSYQWTPVQRKWLERIKKQLIVETIVDMEAFEQGQFKQQGGFKRLNQIFDNNLMTILNNINESIWEDVN
jgi:type I restriction enzyme, R subunit